MEKVTLNKYGLANSAGMLKVYSFSPETGEYTGASDEYLIKGVGLPASASSLAPPEPAEGEAVVFAEGAWHVVPDHRGVTVFSTADRSVIEITVPGEYPPGTTTLNPAGSYDVWDGDKWVTDATAEQAAAVAEAEAQKAGLISQANSTTQAWQTQLLLGIITDADKAALTLWMKYIQAVQAVDTSTAPDIDWPVKPE